MDKNFNFYLHFAADVFPFSFVFELDIISQTAVCIHEPYFS